MPSRRLQKRERQLLVVITGHVSLIGQVYACDDRSTNNVGQGDCPNMGTTRFRVGELASRSAALPRIVTEIDDVAPVHSRTYRNIVSAAGVLRADRMSLFIKKFSSDSCFQQGCR